MGGRFNITVAQTMHQSRPCCPRAEASASSLQSGPCRPHRANKAIGKSNESVSETSTTYRPQWEVATTYRPMGSRCRITLADRGVAPALWVWSSEKDAMEANVTLCDISPSMGSRFNVLTKPNCISKTPNCIVVPCRGPF